MDKRIQKHLQERGYESHIKGLFSDSHNQLP
jgi:hypothetical protein